MRAHDLSELAIVLVERRELTVDKRVEVRLNERATGGGRRGGVGREVLSHRGKRCMTNREYAS